MSYGNLLAAVGYAAAASATVKTLTTATAVHATLTANAWYEISCPIALMVTITTTDASATTNTGMYLPADVCYPIWLPSSYTYISAINAVADEGAVNMTITPKRPG